MKTERLQCTGTRQWLTCGLTLSLHPEALVLAIFPTVWPYLGAWLVGLLMCMDVCPTCRLPCSRLCMRSTVDLVSNLSLWQQARCFLGLTRAKFFDERAAHCSTTHIETTESTSNSPSFRFHATYQANLGLADSAKIHFFDLPWAFQHEDARVSHRTETPPAASIR